MNNSGVMRELTTLYSLLSQNVENGRASAQYIEGQDNSDSLDSSQLFYWLDRKMFRTPFVVVNSPGGKYIPPSQYTTTESISANVVYDFIDPIAVRKLYDRGATVRFNAVDRFSPRVSEIVRHVSHHFGCDSEPVVFLSAPNATSWPAHRDSVDNIVVQLEGEKNWSVWNRNSETDSLAGKYYNESVLGTPALDVQLSPGDLLYIPTRSPHVVRSSGTASLHLSIAIYRRSVRDAVMALITRELEIDSYSQVLDLRLTENTQGSSVGDLQDQSVERIRVAARQLSSVLSETASSMDTVSKVRNLFKE